MVVSDWRYLAWAINGDGTDTLIHPNVPFTSVTLEPVLSGVSSLTATIPVEVPIFDDGSDQDLLPYSTMIAVEYEGVIRDCFIISNIQDQGPTRTITGIGYVGYLSNLIFEGDSSFTNTDALTVARALWANVQAQPDGNLGLSLDPTVSGVMVGQLPVDLWPALSEGTKLAKPYPEHTEFTYTYTVTAAKPAVTKTTVTKGVKTTTTVTPAQPAVTQTLNCEATVIYPASLPAGSTIIVRDTKTTLVSRDTTGAGLAAGKQTVGVGTPAPPSDSSSSSSSSDADKATETADAAYKLNWYTTTDCKQAFDDLASQGKFDYWEEHTWNTDHTAITHTLRFAAGPAGRVRDDLRFVVGENVSAYPSLEQVDGAFASEVVVLGAGQGSAMIRGTWKLTNNPRTRRVKVVTDSSITSTAAANARAQREGFVANGAVSVTQIDLMDHPNAPIGAWSLGDTITVMPRNAWSAERGPVLVRILSYQLTPESGVCALTVANAERATS